MVQTPERQSLPCPQLCPLLRRHRFPEHAEPAPHVFGQAMGTPQLLVAGPQARLAHGLPVAVQPQALAPAPPPPHVLGDTHVLGQGTFCPQLFVAGPHARPLQALVLLGVQQLRLDKHTPALGHVAEHVTD